MNIENKKRVNTIKQIEKIKKDLADLNCQLIFGQNSEDLVKHIIKDALREENSSL